MGARHDFVIRYAALTASDEAAVRHRVKTFIRGGFGSGVSAAGFAVEKHRVIAETVSGSSCAAERKGFQKLLERMEDFDVLVVTKLDRLGRNTIDVMRTVEKFATIGVSIHCLALGGVDLTSPAGRMTMSVIAAVAQFERDLLIERTISGQARAKAAGVVLGGPPALANGERAAVLAQLSTGISISAAARQAGVSSATIMRARSEPGALSIRAISDGWTIFVCAWRSCSVVIFSNAGFGRPGKISSTTPLF